VLLSQFSWFLFFLGAKRPYFHPHIGPSASLSIHLHQRDSHLVNFLEISRWELLWKFVKTLQIRIKHRTKISVTLHRDLILFTLLRAEQNILNLDNSTEGTHFCLFMASLKGCMLLRTTNVSITRKRRRHFCISIPNTVTRKRHKVTLYVHCLCYCYLTTLFDCMCYYPRVVEWSWCRESECNGQFNDSLLILDFIPEDWENSGKPAILSTGSRM
jgi:hypothetical protein